MFKLNPQHQKIGVFAPSSYIDEARFASGVDIIKQYGFDVSVHKQSYTKHRQSAGTHSDKLSALYGLHEDKSIGMIMAAGGGNRSLHLLDKIDYDRLNPDVAFCGYSDSTALLFGFTQKIDGFKGVYGPMVQNLSQLPKADLDYFFALLKGDAQEYPFTDDTAVLQEGAARGRLIGGTLSLLPCLTGTPYMPNSDGTILYIEDCYEETSRLDRMLAHLKLSLPFSRLSGIIIGTFSKLQDTGRPFGFSIDDIIAEHIADFTGPVIKTAAFGHDKHMRALPCNVEAHLTALDGEAALSFI